jgi:RimJ/RimL family protein N-acetyltransferase
MPEEGYMIYNGNLVRLRPPEREDCPLFVSWLRNPDLRQYITIRYVSGAMEERWVEGLLDDSCRNPPGRLHFVIELLTSSEPIGVVALDNINWRDRDAEVGIIIGNPELWGLGYGSDALLIMLDVGFRWYNLHRIHLYVVHTNKRAIRTYEKCGFHKEGCLREAAFIDGRYQDLLVMSILNNEFVDETSTGGESCHM